MLLPPRLHLTVLPGELAVLRLPPDATPPPITPGTALYSVTATPEEISVVCPADEVPADATAARGWRAIRVDGPLAVDTVGLLLSMLKPLAEAKVSVFALSAYDTGYVLVHEASVRTALAVLKIAGHHVTGDTPHG